MQITQELCKRPGLNKAGFDIPTIFIPTLLDKVRKMLGESGNFYILFYCCFLSTDPFHCILKGWLGPENIHTPSSPSSYRGKLYWDPPPPIFFHFQRSYSDPPPPTPEFPWMWHLHVDPPPPITFILVACCAAAFICSLQDVQTNWKMSAKTLRRR